MLYLFLLWVSRSALRELRRTSAPAPEATGFHPVGPGGRAAATDAWLVVGPRRRARPRASASTSSAGSRSAAPRDADVRIEDRFASGDPRARLLARRLLLRRGHELDQRHVPERRAARGRGGAGRPRRDPDRRHRVPLRARRCPGARCSGSPSRRSAPTPGASGRPTRTPTSPGAPLFAVADGMGGAQAGEVASRIAAESFESAVRADESPEALPARDRRGRERAHPQLAQRDSTRSGHGHDADRGARSRATRSRSRHVGDSRAYVFRDGELELLTSDHSLVEELRRQGRLTEEQAEEHPQRSIITRALGPEERGRGRHDDLQRPPRRRVPALLGRADDDGQGRPDRGDPRRDARPRRGGRARWSPRPTRPAGATTSPWSPSGSRRPTLPTRPIEGATLVGPSAEEAGLDGERIRAAGRPPPRRTATAPNGRGAAAGARPPRRSSRCSSSARSSPAAIWAPAQVYFLGHRRRRPVALYRGLPYELPLGIEPLLGGASGRRSRRPRCPPIAVTRPSTTSCARATTPRPR